MNVGEIPKKYRPEPRIWKMLSTKINGKTLENLSKSRPINKPINISVMVTAEIHRPRQQTFDSGTPRDLKYSHNVGKITAERKGRITLSMALKFIYSEMATKFCEISTVDLTGTTQGKSTVEISQNFVAYSEYMNFRNHLDRTCFKSPLHHFMAQGGKLLANHKSGLDF